MTRHLGFVLGRLASAAPAPHRPMQALPPYRLSRTPLQRRLRTAALLSAITVLGIIYGFLVSIFPLAFYLYLSAPILLIVLLSIWALPNSPSFPEQGIRRLYFALFLSTFLWPSYIALSLPGLPWMTLTRLVALPLCLLILVSLSISADFRARMRAPLATSPWIGRLMIAFVVVQLITLPMSAHPADSVNRFVNLQFQWTAVFFLSAYLFAKQGRARLFAFLLVGVAAFLCVLALEEYRLQKVLWADHIPSFLAVQDPVVEKMLAGGSRSGAYRLQSTFTTSLSFAEFLGFVTPFAVYILLTTRNLAAKAAALIYLLSSFWVILATDSRVGAVAFFVSLLLYFLLWALKNWIGRKRDIFAPLLVLAYPVMAGTFFIASFFWIRLHNIIWGGGEQQGSTEARKEQYAAGIREIVRQPFGNGTGQGAEVLGFQNAAGSTTIDTYYLLIALEYGVLGFLIYFGLILSGIWYAVNWGLRSTSREADLLLPAAVMLTVFIIAKSVLAQEDTHSLPFLVLGLIAALVHKMKTDQQQLTTKARTE